MRLALAWVINLTDSLGGMLRKQQERESEKMWDDFFSVNVVSCHFISMTHYI